MKTNNKYRFLAITCQPLTPDPRRPFHSAETVSRLLPGERSFRLQEKRISERESTPRHFMRENCAYACEHPKRKISVECTRREDLLPRGSTKSQSAGCQKAFDRVKVSEMGLLTQSERDTVCFSVR